MRFRRFIALAAALATGITTGAALGYSAMRMALGTTLNATPYHSSNATPMFVVSVKSSWATVVGAGGPAAIDAATVTNPTTEVTRSLTRPFLIGDRVGQYLQVRLAYNPSLTVSTSPTVKVFGRRNGGGWELLMTRGGAKNVALVTSSADVNDGTFKYTVCSATDTVDLLGSDEILVAVEVALAGTGTTSDSLIQVRIL